MSNPLVWDELGEHFYETGVDKGVFYPFNTETKSYTNGEAWNGITGVTDSPEGAEATDLYADNAKYLTMLSAEKLKVTVECYTIPDGFKEAIGMKQAAAGLYIHQQKHTTFGFAYRTKVGNDTEGEDFGYKIHLVYGCKASPSESSYQTTNESPEANTLSFSLSTNPVAANADGSVKTASVTIDSREMTPENLAKLEKILYGSTEQDARLPMPTELITLLSA